MPAAGVGYQYRAPSRPGSRDGLRQPITHLEHPKPGYGAASRPSSRNGFAQPVAHPAEIVLKTTPEVPGRRVLRRHMIALYTGHRGDTHNFFSKRRRLEERLRLEARRLGAHAVVSVEFQEGEYVSLAVSGIACTLPCPVSLRLFVTPTLSFTRIPYLVVAGKLGFRLCWVSCRARRSRVSSRRRRLSTTLAFPESRPRSNLLQLDRGLVDPNKKKCWDEG